MAHDNVMIMGDWQTGKQEIWKPKGYVATQQNKQLIKQARDRSQREKQAKNDHVAMEARSQYQKAQQALVHPYLTSKGINSANGLKQSGQWLLVPLYNLVTNQIMNLQRINQDGTKLFLKGGQVTGVACPIGFIDELGEVPEATERIYLCEGYSTASSIHMMTNNPVIAAMNAGNLLSIAKVIKQKWPDVELIIAGDDDYFTEQKIGINIGKVKALEAAKVTGSKVSFPPFELADKKAGLTDWNDYYLATSNKAA